MTKTNFEKIKEIILRNGTKELARLLNEDDCEHCIFGEDGMCTKPDADCFMGIS